MREKDIVQTVTIKHQAVGTEATKTAVNSVTDAVKGLGNATEATGAKQEQAARRQASALASFEKMERSVSPAARALADYERAQKLVGRAVDQNADLQARGAAVLQVYRDRLAATGAAGAEAAKGTGLARHELINLSRQAQDVAVSLAGGQGFGTVLMQQGSQIMDVLGTSQGGIRGALSGLATSLRGMITIGRVAFGGIAAGAAGAAYAVSDYLEQQKNVERSLIGAGRRSGSAGDINAIANAQSSPTGLSISETREAAVEFARTGQIHSRVIGDMIATTKNFALVTGQSSKEAAAALAGAFTNMQGIDKLNQQFNFLDANSRRAIETMLLAGRTTEAAALANQKLAATLKDVEGTQGAAEKGWNAIANAISNASSKVGEYIAKASGLQAQSRGDRAAGIAGEIETLQSRTDRGDFRGENLDRAKAKVEELRGVLRQLWREMAAAGEQSAFNKLSIDAQRAIDAINPLAGKIRELQGTIERLQAAQAAGINLPGLDQALTQYTLINQQLVNQEAALQRLRAAYPGMTDEFAKQVDALEDQNKMLKARQEGTEATVSAAIAYKNAIAAGANATEAAAIKAETLKNNMLQAAGAARTFVDGVRVGNNRPQLDQFAGGVDENVGGFLGNPAEMPRGSFAAAPDASGYISALARFAMGTSAEALAMWNKESERLRKEQREAPLRAAFGSGIDFNAGNIDDVRRAQGIRMQGAFGNDERGRLQGEIAALMQEPWSLARDARMSALAKSINDLKDSTDALNETMSASLNPLYTEGRSALRIGYYKAARGLEGIVGGSGGTDSTPVHMMLTPGERVTVTPPGQSSNDNSRTIINNVTNIFGGSQSTARRSVRQASQGFAQMMAASS